MHRPDAPWGGNLEQEGRPGRGPLTHTHQLREKDEWINYPVSQIRFLSCHPRNENGMLILNRFLNRCDTKLYMLLCGFSYFLILDRLLRFRISRAFYLAFNMCDNALLFQMNHI